ncbi:MAG TPA: O-antigen ligase family protein [Pyrinomonadaceae bacterium]
MDNSPRQPTSFEERGPSSRVRALRLLDATIFYGLTGVLVFAPLPYGSVEPWWQALFECAVFALGLLWSVHATLNRSWALPDLRLFFPLIALAVLATLQSLSWSQGNIAGVRVVQALSADPFESWIFAIRVLALTAAGVMAVRFTHDSLRLTILVSAIIFIAIASAAFGIVRLTMQHTDGFVLSSLRMGGGFAQFINKNHFAFIIEPAMGLLAAMTLLRTDSGSRKLFYVSAIILLWAALVMSRSRGGVLAVTAEMIAAALIFIYSRKSRGAIEKNWTRTARSVVTTAITVAAILLIITTTMIWLGGDQLSTGVETATTEIANEASDTHEGARRRDIWQATLRLARAHPIAGAGLGGYWAEIPVYHDASGVLTPQQAHNDYLELLASGGLIGAAIFVWFAFALVQQCRKALTTSNGVQRVVACGAILGIFGVAVHSLIEFGLHITANALAFVILLAILSLKNLNQRPSMQEHRTAAFN